MVATTCSLLPYSVPIVLVFVLFPVYTFRNNNKKNPTVPVYGTSTYGAVYGEQPGTSESQVAIATIESMAEVRGSVAQQLYTVYPTPKGMQKHFPW